jgi:hypothetical protein
MSLYQIPRDRIFLFLLTNLGDSHMKFCKSEIHEVEKIINDTEAAIRELGELELSLVGGGSGDAAFG